ncbi:unnamed protein product [Closterium sp. Naga37s-1]|nr:unnamed protein product [Closterium sp. Naga37s-1]CAI5529391.1 unnamed protein product [Closterium sp. Naga37s-1]
MARLVTFPALNIPPLLPFLPLFFSFLSSLSSLSSLSVSSLFSFSSLSSHSCPPPPLLSSGPHPPPPAKPQLPPDYEETTWAKLREAVTAIHEKRAVSCSLEELYRAVEGLCLHKMAAGLYSRLQAECDRHIAAKLQLLLAQGSPDPVLFLEHVAATWRDFCEQMLMIRSIALYLDRTFAMQASGAGVQSLWDMGLRLFRSHLEGVPEVERRTVAGLLQLIERERSGDTVDRSLLKNLVGMFSALGVYSSSFERQFLEETAEFYSSEGSRFMQQTDVRDYLKLVETRLQEENDRCVHYLPSSTRKALIATTEAQLLEKHTGAIVDKGFGMLMEASESGDLHRMYALFARVNALDALRVALSSHVKAAGQAVVMDADKDGDMVAGLLALKARVDGLWEASFHHNEAFGIAIKEAFETLVNMRQNRPAELIAKFIDGKLRAGNKGLSDEELESTLDRVLVLFRFIQGKDVFEAFYKKDLAKRLLLGKSASIDAEKSMISKLKTECGSQFTNKLEGMFKDIELSKEINESFRQSSQAREKLPAGIEMNVHVLTMGYWPTYSPVEVQLPRELGVYQDIFRDFYLGKHSGRRLMWQHSLGHCVVRADFPKGKKELSLSLFQTVVLMLFNDADRLSFAEIRDATGITDAELKRTLQSLACGKTRVLQKIPKGRDVSDTDSFEFNTDFTASLFRLKVNAIQLKETPEENTNTTERVFQDRQYQIDAAIVRIMKTRKVLSHTLLITELFQQLKFPIKPADLKKRIESLIDREYLERDKSNAQIYNYLA